MPDSERIAVGDVYLSKDEQYGACAPSEACFAIISLHVHRKKLKIKRGTTRRNTKMLMFGERS